MRKALGLSVLLLLGWGVRASADVKPNPLFTDNMVLQQGAKVAIWGTADNGEKVTVRFQGQEVSTTANDRKWRVDLTSLKASDKPSELTIAGGNTITLKNILVGEVWVCSGQSNMQWPVSASANAQQVIANSKNFPNLRLFTVNLDQDDKPRQDVKGTGWHMCSPAIATNFSAVGLAFGQKLHEALKVPVGLINSSYGGTAAEWWMSKEGLEGYGDHKALVDRDRLNQENVKRALANYERQVEAHKKAVAKAKEEGKPAPRPPQRPFVWNLRLSGLYNAMVHPLQPFAIKGAIWYQGESNGDRGYQYRTLFPAMIADWRKTWGQGDFSFLFVQLAPWGAKPEGIWAELREAQLLTSLTVPNTAMAVITDLGDEKDIHPRQKEPVGARLALAARAIAYGEKIVYSGPLYSGMTVNGNKAILRFKYVGGGLIATGGALNGFTVAGDDRQFVPAQAEIEGDTVVVWNSKVSKPIAVRYGWLNYPTVNLFNKEGLPASPFRTDDFPGITQTRAASAR